MSFWEGWTKGLICSEGDFLYNDVISAQISCNQGINIRNIYQET